MGPDDYAARFRSASDVTRYESFYEPGTRDHFIWSLQVPFVTDVIHRINLQRTSVRLLDFACGTGRVLRLLENLVSEADGLDASPQMAARARQNCSSAEVHVGTLAPEHVPDGVCKDYDVVTAFRFFLNVDEELRRDVLQSIRDRLRARRGWVVLNNHGNRVSARHLALRGNTDPRAMHNELSDAQTRSLLEEAGFAVQAVYGFGLLPDVVHRSPLREPVQRLERWAARQQKLTSVSIDRIYVAQVRESDA